MKTSLTLSVEVLAKLKKSRDRFKYDTLNNLLLAMNNFFIENGLRPDETVNYHLTSAIQEIKFDFKTRDESLRKWIGKISHVDLTSLHNDMAYLKTLLTDKMKRELEENVTLQIQEHKKEIREEPKLIITEKEPVDVPQPTLDPQLFKSYENLVKEKDVFLKKYHDALVELTKNVKTPPRSENVFLEVNRHVFDEIKNTLL